MRQEPIAQPAPMPPSRPKPIPTSGEPFSCAQTRLVHVRVVTQEREMPLANFALVLNEGAAHVHTDARGVADLGALKPGDYRLAPALARYAVTDSREEPASADGTLSLTMSVSEVGMDLPEIEVRATRGKWCGLLSQGCDTALKKEKDLAFRIGLYTRSFPH